MPVEIYYTVSLVEPDGPTHLKPEGSMTKIRKDQTSIFVIAGGYVARPGPVRGFDHAYDMSEGDLVEGDTVKAHHIGGSSITKIVTSTGRTLHWHHEGRRHPLSAKKD